MGLLIDGQWHDQWYDTKSTAGRFVRQDAAIRDWVTRTDRPGSRPSPTAIISTYRSPAPGPTAPSFSAN